MIKFEINDIHFLPHLSCHLKLELKAGDGIIITGPNGIGKTSVVRKIINDYQSKIELSFIGQGALDYFYDRKLKDIRNILLTSRPKEINESALNQLWNLFGFSEKENRYLSALSGGELQALKLVLGLSKRSQLFILDEPLQSLDQERKKQLIDYLETLRKSQHSILVVEHELQYFSADWKFQPLIVDKGVLITGPL